jgi:hypothetical protein
LDSQTGANYVLVGNNPFVTAVPLEKLNAYKLIYDSPSKAERVPGITTSDVRIFEYLP